MTTQKLKLIQGKTWKFTGIIYDKDDAPLSWAHYGLRGMARVNYDDVDEAWNWILTTGADGGYTATLGAVASAVVPAGIYLSDIEAYSLTDTDIVEEVIRLSIIVLPEATK